YLHANRMVSHRYSLRFEARFANITAVLHAALVADVVEDESASAVGQALHILHKRDGLVDRTAYLKNYLGVLEWCILISFYHASDTKDVIVNRRGLGVRDQPQGQKGKHCQR